MSEKPDIPPQRIVIGLESVQGITTLPGFANIVRVQATAYPVYQFQARDGTPIFTIWPDGRTELGAHVTLDEASAAFWAHVIACNPILARPCPECGGPMVLTCADDCGF